MRRKDDGKENFKSIFSDFIEPELPQKKFV